MSTVRVGVWGVGAWGEKHARVYATLPGVTFAGVYDEQRARAEEVARQYGCRTFASPDEMLEACDAVSIAVPTIHHRACFERAAAAGRHALVEKPLAATVLEADAMLKTAQRAGVTLQVGQVERFNPTLLAGRPHLADPRFIEAHRLALFQPRSLDIDVVFDLMIHDIDIVLQAVGSYPERISAVGVAVLSQREDIANARLEFANGCVANLTASRVSQERLRRVRFFTADRYVSLDLFEKTGDALWVDRARLDPRAPHTAIRREKIDVPAGEPLTLELAAFIGALRGEGTGAASGVEGRDALRVAEEVQGAMRHRAAQWAAPSNRAS
jgi:predicted dehydrogenase